MRTLTALLAIMVIASAPLSAHPRLAESPPVPASSFMRGMADTNDVVDTVAATTMALHLDGHPLRVPYFANRPLEGSYLDVTRAIVVICGTLRNANDYYSAVVQAGQMAGGADAHTLIIAPQFLSEPDIDQHHLPSDYLYWAYMGWRQGDHSLDSDHNPRPARISSFAVVDTILLRIARQNPNVSLIVVAGHSAGGQFSNLYAAGNRMEQTITGIDHIPIHYIVSNPSCYIYFNDERWVRGAGYTFAVPTQEQIAQCPNYNHYKYGLEYPNEYMDIGSDQLIQQYGSRHVVYLLGNADTNPHDFYLDTSCMAEMEGAQRLERGTVYWHFIGHFYGTGVYDVQKFAVVPGVGHDHFAMFASQCGRFYLYDYGQCPDAPPPSAKWEDVTTNLLARTYTHGVAWGDYDGDRMPDLYLPAVAHPSTLAHNDGGGAFSDGTRPPIDDGGHGMIAVWGDYDNDGRPDLYLVKWKENNRLFHNDGGGSFSDVTNGPLGVNGDCDGASWVDYDNDGDLDLYVVRTSGQSNILLRNDGPGGFIDASSPPLNFAGNTRTACWGDFDNDGDQDVYLAVDGANKLLRNDRGGHFTDVTGNGPLANNGDCSAAAWGDYDNDGRLDLYLVNRNSSNRLLHNDGNGRFSDVTNGPLGLHVSGRAVTWGDYDNDGLLDLYVSNSATSNRLLRNEGGGVFADSTAYPLDGAGSTYSSAWADFDGDGDIDLFEASAGTPNRLVRNSGAAAGNSWIQVDLVGTLSNRSAIGARVRVVAAGFSQIRQIGGDAGYLSQNSMTVSLGLGSALLVDTLEVRWPSGIVQTHRHFDVNQHLVIWESDQPEDAADGSGVAGRGLETVVPNPFRSTAEIRYSLGAMGASPVSLEIYDPAGRIVRRLACDTQAGPHVSVWDGRTEAGRKVAPGVYFCRLTGAARRSTLRMVLLER